jgi:hypothetical protein
MIQNWINNKTGLSRTLNLVFSCLIKKWLMINFIIFIQQISKSVLPKEYYIIVNNSYIRIFRLLACTSIIILFLFKNVDKYIYVILLVITYSYICYQCIIIIAKFYYVYNTIITDNKIKYLVPINYCKTILLLLLVIKGIPFISDTIIEIFGDIKHIIQILLNKKDNK